MQQVSYSEEETRVWGLYLVRQFPTDKPCVVCLFGEMGMGKTQVAKGIAEGLGIKEVVTSPSYVLVRLYEGGDRELVHVDCWRTQNVKPEELELQNYLKPGTVILVEWPDPLMVHFESLGDSIHLLKFRISADGNARIIEQL